MSWQPGLVARIDERWIHVKVRADTDCAACQGKNPCTFQGPDSAYRTLKVPRCSSYRVGEQVSVEEPDSVLWVTLLALIVVPVALMLGGYGLRSCCLQGSFATPALWVVGVLIWLAALYGVNRWMSRAASFQTRIRPKPSMAASYTRGTTDTTER